ncbi:MAG: nucleoside kinase [Lachnospiraceae bacterium]|nr:nucleoside kinase [Lachnospiraceae bacterium]
MYQVTVRGETKAYPEGTSYEEIALEHQKEETAPIVLAIAGGKLCELFTRVHEDTMLSFVTMAQTPGIQSYHRSAVMLALKAVYKVAGRENVQRISVEFSVSKGLYLEPRGNFALDEAFVSQVEEKMRELVSQELPIEKRTVGTNEAIRLFRQYEMPDKEKLFSYRRVSRVNLYRIGQFEDYFYGYMVPNTRYLKWFRLYRYADGFVIQLPQKDNPTTLEPFAPSEKVFATLKESNEWSARLGVNAVGDLNDLIVNGGLGELILVQEALMEKKLGKIAEAIAQDRRKKIILVAGPSSSGKTSFSHRLSIQLKTYGLTPHPIAVDNYFRDRVLAPRDEEGNYNFEALECVDVELFNEHMLRLLAGEEVALAKYNFNTGKQELGQGDRLRLSSDDILVIEGIHCLNDRMTYRLPSDCRYRIYISALTQLNVDEHNRIPTTDGRLIRRIVRDARTRGHSARDTIAQWNSVRRGEEQNIFPYQESADVVFNSALIYELSVLKAYAEPLLFSVPRDSKEYQEAKRLLKFFDYFLPVASEDIPRNSLLREFIGGSLFPVG